MKGLIFTYAMTYGGSAVALFNPYIGFLIYVAFAILKPESLWGFSVPVGNYSRIIAIALLVGWLLQGTGRWQFGRARGVVFLLLGFFAWSVVCAVPARDQEWAWGFIEDFAKIVLPFLVGITLIDSVRKLKQLAWVIALCHGFIAYEFNLSYYDGTHRIFLGHGGMEEGGVALAMVLSATLSFYLGLNASRWWLKALAFSWVILEVHVVLFALARSGMLGLIAVASVSFLIMPKKPQHYVLLALAVVLTLRLAGPQVREEFMTIFASEKDRDSSAQSRIELWSACWDSMLKRPVFGVGPNHFPLIATEYGWPRGKEAHSLWLQIGAELGFPGLGLLLAFYGLCALRLWPLARGRLPVPDPWLRDMALMVITVVAGFSVVEQFMTLEGLEVPYYVVLLGAGILKLTSVSSVSSVSDR